MLRKCELPIKELYQTSLIGHAQALRVRSVAYDFMPISKESDYEIDVLEPLMGYSFFDLFQKIVK